MREVIILLAAAIAAQPADPLASLRTYLHPGATASEDGAPPVIQADVDGDGIQEMLVFYYFAPCKPITPTCHDDPTAEIDILKPKGVGYVRQWSFTDWGWGFDKPTGILMIRGEKTPLIVALSRVGASCPGQLRVFQFRGDQFQKVYTWDEDNCASLRGILDLDGDGIPEIAFSRGHRELTQVFRWDGRTFVNASERYPRYYDADLQWLRESFFGPERTSLQDRWDRAQSIVDIYRLQKRPAELSRFLNDAAAVLNSDRILREPQLDQRRQDLLRELDSLKAGLRDAGSKKP